MSMKSTYDLGKIKFGTDPALFERAVKLYESGKVTKFSQDIGEYSATVIGGNAYRVFVSARGFDRGDCECYMGQNGELCKHMVAVAIQAVKKGEKLTEKDKKLTASPVCSEKKGALSDMELKEAKHEITAALRHIKSYDGPSRTWFTYQNSLREGCARLSAIVSEFPVCTETARLLVDLLLRLEKKVLNGGVDDSDGTVGGFMTETVEVLRRFSDIDPITKEAFGALRGLETSFGWEEPLVKLLDNK